jgi:hypothetical protein
MVTRQSGHIFFEPRGYDAVNDATDEHKESIKVGYNMQRKAILIVIWLASPAILLVTPTLCGLVEPQANLTGFVHHVGLLWLALGVGGVLFRMLHLFFLRGPVWGAAWAAKIVTDPFHNISIYWRSPIALLHGQLIDPIEPSKGSEF